MKIVHLMNCSSRNAGGLFQSVRGPAILQQKRYQDKLFVMSIKDKDSAEDDTLWHPIPVKNYVAKVPMVGYAPQWYQDLREINPDIVHTHGLWRYHSYLSNKWGKLTKTPYMISLHGMLNTKAIAQSSYKKYILKHIYENEHLNNASCIRVLCEQEAEMVLKLHIKAPICIISNGVEIPREPEMTVAPPWKDQILTGRKVLLFMNRINPIKGIENLIEAWKKISTIDNPSVNEWDLVIAGWGNTDYVGYINGLIENSGKKSRIYTIGPIFDQEKRAALSQANAFILPSYSEGIPMAVLEAWSYGLPTLITPECNLQDGIARGAGLMIQPNVNSLVKEITTLMDMPESDLKSMGDAGRAFVADKFTIATITDKLREVYKWMLGENSKPASVI